MTRADPSNNREELLGTVVGDHGVLIFREGEGFLLNARHYRCPQQLSVTPDLNILDLESIQSIF
jgi:hypothetical protein